MKIFSLFFFVTLFALISCSKSDNPSESCYNFDQRQCQTDEFGEDIATADSSQWAGIIEAYLESKSVEVLEVKIDFEYYEAVCEACDVCPEMHRFYVKINSSTSSVLEELNLMNLEEDDCGEFF